MLNGICFLINYLSFPTGHGSSNPLQLLASVERIQNLPKCCTLVKFDNAGQVFKIHAGCCWTDMVLVKDGKGIAFLKTFFLRAGLGYPVLFQKYLEASSSCTWQQEKACISKTESI